MTDLDKAKKDGFLVTKSQKWNSGMLAKYTDWCYEEKRPWIHIITYHKYADLVVHTEACLPDDCGPHKELDPACRKYINGLFTAIDAMNIHSKFNVGPDRCWIVSMPIEAVERIGRLVCLSAMQGVLR